MESTKFCVRYSFDVTFEVLRWNYGIIRCHRWLKRSEYDLRMSVYRYKISFYIFSLYKPVSFQIWTFARYCSFYFRNRNTQKNFSSSRELNLFRHKFQYKISQSQVISCIPISFVYRACFDRLYLHYLKILKLKFNTSL